MFMGPDSDPDLRSWSWSYSWSSSRFWYVVLIFSRSWSLSDFYPDHWSQSEILIQILILILIIGPGSWSSFLSYLEALILIKIILLILIIIWCTDHNSESDHDPDFTTSDPDLCPDPDPESDPDPDLGPDPDPDWGPDPDPNMMSSSGSWSWSFFLSWS